MAGPPPTAARRSLLLLGYPGFVVLVCLAFLLGLGSGAVDSGLNAYAASAFGPRHMNWLHAFFGLGVALGPLIMTAAISSGPSWRLGYVVVAAGQAALALAFVLTARRWAARGVPDSGVDATPIAAVRSRETLTMPAVWIGVLAFGVYVAVEVGAGLFAYQLLTEG